MRAPGLLDRRSACHRANRPAARRPARRSARRLAGRDAGFFARWERPHPGAQLTLFEAEDGWRYTLWATNRPADTKGWLGQAAYLDAAHRVRARVEDVIRTGKDAGLGHFPDYAVNAAWLTAAMTAQILLGWLRLLALGADLARAEPKTRRILHGAARLTRGGGG